MLQDGLNGKGFKACYFNVFLILGVNGKAVGQLAELENGCVFGSVKVEHCVVRAKISR